MNKSLLMREIKENPDKIDELLYPEKHIADFNPEDLRISVIPSGFPSLDELMLLKEGRSELIIVGGRPSHGKSAFMFQLAHNLAQTAPVHVFSLEMDREQIQTRQIAARLNRSINYIQRGLVDDKTLIGVRNELKGLQYFIDDRPGLSIVQLCDAARVAANRLGTKAIIIDYLQLINRAEKGYSKDDEVGAITRQLKELAKELRVPIIVGSQLNRNCENRGKEYGDYRPMLADLRESGNIEQDADMVLFIHRQSRYTGERPGEVDIIVAKNRNGPVADITMEFSETQTKFIDKAYDV